MKKKYTNYIVLDLEFTCDSKYITSTDDQTFREIIQIGAVKFNSNLEIVDTYTIVVRPYQLISNYCMKLTGISKEELYNAIHLDDGILVDFFNWAGDNSLFFTWSGNDKLAMKYNAKELGIDIDFTEKHFIDLQKFYMRFYDLKKPISLKSALTQEAILFEGKEHNALDDAKMTAILLRKMIDKDEKLSNFLNYVSNFNKKIF